MIARILILCLGIVSLLAPPALAQKKDVPYWAVIDTTELNMRVGPSREYKIIWVYRRKGLPIKVIRVVDGWRLVRDYEGAEGWVSQGLLRRTRGAIVIGEGLAAMRSAPAATAVLRWNVEPGVVGRLKECEAGWCEINVAGRAGWVRSDRLWGHGAP